MYPLMDQAIRWVLDYAEGIEEYRHAVEQARSEIMEGRRNQGGHAFNQDHYLRKLTNSWIKSNQPEGLDIAFDSYAHSQKTHPKPIPLEQVKQANLG